jgi:flagellar protein FliO/FliZ
MFDTSFALKALFTFVVVFAAVALIVWLVRRFGGQRLAGGAARGRQPRLAVIDQATVDSRRRLVLIRRDNIEHLLMIGGPTDVVIEPHIVRAAAAPRDAAAVRPLPAGEALARALPLGEGSMWPLQPEGAPRADPMLPRPEPAPRSEPMLPRPEQATRSQRPPPPPVAQERAHQERVHQEPTQRTAPEPEPSSTSPSSPASPARERRLRQDPLSGLAEELGRIPPSPEPTAFEASPRQAPRREPRARPQPAPASAPPAAPAGNGRFASPADQNLAEMAQRLEAALRRPNRSEDVRLPSPAPKVEPKAEPNAETIKNEPKTDAHAEPTTEAEELALPPSAPHPRSANPTNAGTPAPNEAKPARGDAKPMAQKSLYDSLEQEMASLLGRPGGKN